MATLVFAAAGVRYTEPPELPSIVKMHSTSRLLDVRFSIPMSATSPEIEEALESNLFSASRMRPAVRFGEPAVGNGENPVAHPIRNTRLLGTTVAGAQSFAILEEQGKPGRVVRLNEQFLDYTVKKIERGRVVLESKDSTVVLDLNKVRQ